ncbi:MAG TPA: cbb3-type cytochrome c oxidase subunit 3 [Geminicoccaceae bacterium]|nr:cbb3-type cytochrome c oxidase subunit 3 [Geminicoccaceae bacterium]
MSELYLWIRSLWMVWLLLVFVAGVVWIMWPSRRQEMEEHGKIPFRSDDEG